MDEVARLIRRFTGLEGESALAWKRDLLLDLGGRQDPRIAPFLLSVLVDEAQAEPVRLDALCRIRERRPELSVRPRVALVLIQIVWEEAALELRLQAADALGELIDLAGVVDTLGELATTDSESLDLRYTAFASLERAGPTDECLTWLRRLAQDEVFGPAAAAAIRVIQSSLG